ncbi:MAG: response regulator [Xenococcaceae cyanobacterium]
MRILLIEDDERLSVILANTLSKQNYIVDVAKNSQEALEFLDILSYDLLLLDVVLPGMDGITFCRQLRCLGFKIPILLLTARDASTDKVKGLDAGADDYLIKPFDFPELLARLRALLRRGNFPIISKLQWGDLCLIPSTGEVTYRNQPLQLTPTEYNLLELFLRNSRKVFSYDDLIEHLWPLEPIPSESTIRSHIKGLRKKLKVAGASADLIETVYGRGYRLKARKRAEEQKRRGAGENSQSKIPNSKSQIEREQKTLAAMRQSWEQFRESVFEDVAFLEKVATDAQTLKSTSGLQAIRTAHNLVGLLGSLGLAEGARISREIENLLQSQSLKGIQERIEILRRVLISFESPPKQISQPPSSHKQSPKNPPLLLIIDEDIELTEQLRQLALHWEIQVEVATSLSVGRKQIQSNRPDAIILDLCVPNETEDGLSLLAELNTQTPPIPVLVLTERGELNHRLQASKAQAVAFLQKPYSPEKVLAMVNQTLQKSRPIPGKILVVDDDPKFLSLLRTRLELEELEVTTLSDPILFWETLETISPDVLILDLQMPDLDGLELCRVVRNDPRWHDLPILFLSAYIDELNLQRFVAAGADDFVSKSALDLELRPRIFSHLQRVRRLRQMPKIRSH